MEITYKVEVKAVDGWTLHSEHDSYRDAVDQADMVHGRVVGDEQAWKWAVNEQGFVGTYAEWQAQDDEERNEYELGAAGISS